MPLLTRLEKQLGPIPPLSFGAWGIGGEYWGEQKHQDSVRAIHKAMALGITHFDTAPVYGKGRSEQLIGQQLKKVRQDYTLATKAFYTDPDTIEKSLKLSLKRLLTDYIDIFYIHWPKSSIDMRPGLERLEQLRAKGIIRAIGVSNFSLEQLKDLESAGSIDVYQGGYNLIWRKLEERILPYCQKKEIAFIPYGILAQGILSDQGEQKIGYPHEGYRDKMILFQNFLQNDILYILGDLKKLAKDKNRSIESLSIAYCIQRGKGVTNLIGIRNREQAELNFSFEPLSPRDLVYLDNCYNVIKNKIHSYSNIFNHIS